MNKYHSSGSDSHPGWRIVLGIIILGMLTGTGYLLYRANQSDRVIIQLNFLALLSGLVFEYKRISEKWSTVLWTALGALLLSFWAFTKDRNEQTYIFEEHLETWPYYFLGGFILIALAVQYNTVTKKINEGITLLITLAFNYWIIANNYFGTASVIIKALILANALVSIFVIFHVFSYSSLSKMTRLVLSIWSSIIILILSIDNFIQLYKLRDIENIPSFQDSTFVFFQYFLLGVSSIYIAQNITMIAAYIPGKKYLETIREINDVHLSRYSNEQVYKFDAIVVMLLGISGFGLNYFYEFFQVNFMIWLIIAFTPYILRLIQRIFS